METEMDHQMMDQGDQANQTVSPEDTSTTSSPDEQFMPLESTTDTPVDGELMYTTGQGVEYQSTIDDISSATDLSSAQVAGLTALLGVYAVFILAVLAISLVMMWKIFSKAGRAGWESLIPIYNAYVLLQITGRPGWWLILLIIAPVNIVIAVILSIDLAKSFGKSTTFGVVGLFLFSLVGYAILAFGKDTYLGPGGLKSPEAPVVSTPEAAPPVAPAA